MTRIKSRLDTDSKPTRPKQRANPYAGFQRIDGTHPYRKAVPEGFVDYLVRERSGGRVFYFNFELGREMGLLPRDHGDTLTKGLEQAILNTFSLEIINEYDLLHGPAERFKGARPQTYMATRYLQLQHPDKSGRTSGDGRSIWNGCFRAKGVTWDVTSCGTGATRLSPATANEKRFFKTGDENASYGCGRADIDGGLGAATMSEILHTSKIPTERTLAVIAYEDGTAVNVRAGKNLLRPAHLFAYLKQGDYAALKGAVDYHIARQVENGEWPQIKNVYDRYADMLDRLAVAFGHAAALYEREYIFCWMEWDGDNILMDGGIIDYGSIRQFGLYHHHYRYDDVDRYSTTITGQRKNARYIVQTFAQMVDFLMTGEKKNIKRFSRHPSLQRFDEVFDYTWHDILLYKMGYWRGIRRRILQDSEARAALDRFVKPYGYFERAKARRGPYYIPDGITWDAI